MSRAFYIVQERSLSPVLHRHTSKDSCIRLCYFNCEQSDGSSCVKRNGIVISAIMLISTSSKASVNQKNLQSPPVETNFHDHTQRSHISLSRYVQLLPFYHNQKCSLKALSITQKALHCIQHLCGVSVHLLLSSRETSSNPTQHIHSNINEIAEAIKHVQNVWLMFENRVRSLARQRNVEAWIEAICSEIGPSKDQEAFVRVSQTTYLFASELNAGKDASAASRFVRRHKTHS
ncbi:unnamed protein product [Albugo candida]|uniref:Uncharacterized protein n=1 Tax=Albugo candida TaxID=65357 RepID=A0A024GM11_9STRA|nr:unnamed protein product [Albugo candida]CCI47777.1 unnamed protein product [Albugo candida]|eukprot:CCI10613.1 unnamed protein product [Albugo candida]